MRKNNRKGFTIVELVIVIAVIAILAGVLIPTFAGVATKAKKSAALQEARNTYTAYVTVAAEKGEKVENCWIKAGSYYVEVVDGSIDDESVTDAEPTAEEGKTILIIAEADTENGTVTKADGSYLDGFAPDATEPDATDPTTNDPTN